MKIASIWRRLTAWPDDPLRALGLPDEETASLVKDLFAVLRWRVELLNSGAGDAAIRCPCRHGELYPVGSGRWGWTGSGGTWALRLMRLLGDSARNPAGGRVTAGTKYDEAAILFPAVRLSEVARAVGVKRRHPPRILLASRLNEPLAELESIPIPKECSDTTPTPPNRKSTPKTAPCRNPRREPHAAGISGNGQQTEERASHG